MRVLARRLRHGLAGRLLAALASFAASRRNMASLNGLDERMLKDVGLYRSDVEVHALHRAGQERRERQLRRDES